MIRLVKTKDPNLPTASAKILNAYLNAVNTGDLEKDGYQHRIVDKLQTLNDNIKDYSIKPKTFFSKVPNRKFDLFWEVVSSLALKLRSLQTKSQTNCFFIRYPALKYVRSAASAGRLSVGQRWLRQNDADGPVLQQL